MGEANGLPFSTRVTGLRVSRAESAISVAAGEGTLLDTVSCVLCKSRKSLTDFAVVVVSVVAMSEDLLREC